jgi:hypothetical protein
MNPLLHADLANARSAEIARNLNRHRAAPASPRPTSRPKRHRMQRMFSALRPVHHA